MTIGDTRDFFSSERITIIKDNNDGNSADILKVSIGNDVLGEITPSIGFSDEWSTKTENFSGGGEYIDKINLSNLLDIPENIVWDNEKETLTFKDDSLLEYDSTGCPIDGTDKVSLTELSGDIEILTYFDKVNQFGKVYDFQFRKVEFGQYRFANTRICSAISSSLGYLSVDKLINDEKIRMERQNSLYEKYKDDEEKSKMFLPYSGFLVDDTYINEGWIDFDHLVYKFYESENSYDEDSSISIVTKKFLEAKRALVLLCLNYSSNITELASFNKITDFGIRIIDKTTGQELDFSNFKNDLRSFYGNSGIATFTGKLDYVAADEAQTDASCDPCTKIKVDKCTGEMTKVANCNAPSDVDNEGVNHVLSPQFRLNPLIDARKSKSDILNTIDPIQWTTGTQNFTETDFPGITDLREEFGEDALESNRLNEDRGFALGGGKDSTDGFVSTGFYHQLDPDTDSSTYGIRSSTEEWNGTVWVVAPAGDVPTPRGAGLGGGEKEFKSIAFGTKSNYFPYTNLETASPVPNSFTTTTESSDTLVFADGVWYSLPSGSNTNVPRHSVAGFLSSSYRATNSDGKDVKGCNGGSTNSTTLTGLLGENVEDDVNISLCPEVLAGASAFIRDAGARAAGKMTNTSLKMVGPAFDPNCFNGTGTSESDLPVTSGSLGFSLPQLTIGGEIDCDSISIDADFSNTSGFAQDFIVPLCPSVSNKLPSFGNIFPGKILGIDPLKAAKGKPVESWKDPITLPDGSIAFKDDSAAVDPGLLRTNSSGKPSNVDAGNYYEFWNLSGIAFNGSTGDLKLDGIVESELSDTFEFISWMRIHHHTTVREGPTAYKSYTFRFEEGCWNVDTTRKYPIKTVGTYYVGDECSGLSTGGKTSNTILGCEDNSASLNMKYGYFSDSKYNEFDNSVINIAYENNGSAWVRRDNLPENVCYHVGVGDKNHALFWGGIHASLETPNVSVSFPGCDDWYQMIKNFGGVFHRRGNIGLDKEVRYSFFATQAVDSFGNHYYKAGDLKDPNKDGIVYSDEYIAAAGSTDLSGRNWEGYINDDVGHVYSVTYTDKNKDVDEPQTELDIVYFVKGESWIGESVVAKNLSNKNDQLPYAERQAAAVLGALGESESTDQVGEWIKSLLAGGFDSFDETWRPDTETNSFPLSGYWPTLYNNLLNGSDKQPVWKYSGHPVDGAMWIWSRPTPGESLFDPKNLHPEPIESFEWQSLEKWKRHSFENHSGLEYFYTKYDSNYSDLVDYSYETPSSGNYKKTVYWVVDNFDANSENTYTTLYDYDPFQIEKFLDDYAGQITYNSWQSFLAKEGGRVRVRSEDPYFKFEYLRDVVAGDDSLFTYFKKGVISSINIAVSGSENVSFNYPISSCLSFGSTYDISLSGTSSIPAYSLLRSVGGFTIELYGPYVGDITWTIQEDILPDVADAWCSQRKSYNEIAATIAHYYENSIISDFREYTKADIVKVVSKANETGLIPKESLSDPLLIHVPEEALTIPIKMGNGQYRYYTPTPYDVSVYADIFSDPDMSVPLDQLTLKDWSPLSPVTSGAWALPRYVLQTVLSKDTSGNLIQTTKKVLSYTKTQTENPKDFFYSHNLASNFDSYGRRFYLPKVKNQFIEDFNVSSTRTENGLLITPELNKRYIDKYFPDSVLSNNLACSSQSGLVVDGITYLDTGRYSDNTNSCAGFAFRTNQDLTAALSYGNNKEITSGKFDMFWFNNVTRRTSEINAGLQYKSASQYDQSLDVLAQAVYMPSKNSSGFDDYHYFYKVNTWSASISSGDLTPTSESYWISAGIAPDSECLTANTSAGDYYPGSSCWAVDTLNPSAAPITDTTVDSISYQVSGAGYIFTASGRYLTAYDTSEVPDISAGFAYHFGYERTLHDVSPVLDENDKFEQFDYFRYRFSDHDENDWLYMPNISGGQFGGGDALDDLGFATSTYAPSGITYSFYITRNCEGLDQFIWGRDKKTFVEKWKYPHPNEIISALDINSAYDEVGTIGTMVGDLSGNKNFTEINDFSQFKYGTLSVGKFAYPEITTEEINNGTENPLKSIIKGITERQSDDVSVFGVSSAQASAAWEDLYDYLDAAIPDDEQLAENYYPLTFDTYQGNPSYLPQLPFFKVDEAETNVRFLPNANSSSIRDRAALWPWCDLLSGDARNVAVPGNTTWQFTSDKHFWIAEAVSRDWITPKACQNVTANTDPLNRNITHTKMYPDDGYWRETFRIRRYDNRSQLVFDYEITYDEAAGPEIQTPKYIATDYNMFGMNMKKKTIDLQYFSNKPINGPTQTWVSDLDESKSWLASNWLREEISDLRRGIADIQPEVAGISATISELYNYRHESLCEMITGGYNKTAFLPSEGIFCEANQDSIWAYSVPFGNQTGFLDNESFFIEESPYVRTAVISGNADGYDDLGDITENIKVVYEPLDYTCIAEIISGGTTYLSGGSFYTSGGTVILSGGQECGPGSQIVHAKRYVNNGKTGLRMSRAIVAGPNSRGIGMLDYGKSQAFNKELLHKGSRQPCTYKVNENTIYHPSDSVINKSWPWNVIGQGGTIGPKGFTDLIDGEGNYWFAMGEKYNYEEVEKASSGNVNYKNSYVIGMVKSSNISELNKTAIAKTNYNQAKETLDSINVFAPGTNYSLIDSGNTGSRLREAILELVHTSKGADIFELYIRLMEENIIDVDASDYSDKYKNISDYQMPKDTNGILIDSKTLPLSALSITPSVTELQELQIVNDTDPECLNCLTCASETSDYGSTVTNPTPWFQHNHDQWITPFLESPFSGPYSIDGFNVWLTAGNTARWGTPMWSTVKDGKFWISYRRARIHANPYRGHVVLAIINSTIAIEDFGAANNNNIPVYTTYDEFLFDYDDYKNLNIIKEIVANENLGALGRDCSDNLAAYVPVEYPEYEEFNTGSVCLAPSGEWQSVYNLGTYSANISGFSSFPTSAWGCPGEIVQYSVIQVPVSAASYITLSQYNGCSDIDSFSVASSAAALSGEYVFITTISSEVTGCSGIFVCPDNNPNEKYTEWATSFVQEYKNRKISDKSGVLRKYFFKYDVMNTYDSNTLLELPNISDKPILPNDWRRLQDGVGLGGDAPAFNVFSDAERACNQLNQYYVGQTAFGNTSNAVIVGGFSIQTDGELTSSHAWWERTTTGTTFKWSTEIISPEDSVNNNYKNRNFSPFFTNGEQTLSSTTHGAIIFDLSKQITIERQGIAEFSDQNEFEVQFTSPLPEWATNKDKYSITLMPDQNVKAWWTDKTENGFTIKVESENWTGSVDWQITLIDDIPSSEVDNLSTQETFDKFNNL